MQSGKKDPVTVLNYLSKNKLNIEYCKFIVDMNYIPKLMVIIDFQDIRTQKKSVYHAL